MKRCAIRLPIAVTAILLGLTEGVALAADPTTADCVGASNASLKLGNEHKLRAERAQLLVCAAASCPEDIKKECGARVSEVNQQIPTIVFSAKDSTGADLSAVRITLDGEVLAEQLEGTAFSIDPGEHTFTFETAGQSPVNKTYLIQQAQKDRRELITFGTPTPTLRPPPPPPPPPLQESRSFGTQKVLALVAGGLGVVGLGVGIGLGVEAISKKNAARGICPNSDCPTPEGTSAWDDAVTSANVSTAGWIVGGLGIAGGAVLWFTAPSSGGGASTKVGIGPGVLQVKGTW